NQNESDVDCGGSCAKCQNGKICGVSADCGSNLCMNMKCSQAPSFSIGPTLTGQVGPAFITSADFNADGWPDLAMVNQSSNTVTVYLNAKLNGTFNAGVSYAVGSTPFNV